MQAAILIWPRLSLLHLYLDMWDMNDVSLNHYNHDHIREREMAQAVMDETGGGSSVKLVINFLRKHEQNIGD